MVGAQAGEDRKVVAQIQATLGVPVDGKMGPKTAAALKRYQHAKGLEPSGELDAATRKALGLTGPKPAPAASAGSEAGKPTTPVGPAQSSAERTAEPKAEPAKPTGEKAD
jgi:peptidoglycan hydrolase-like protein with peptidoglycan-binding domain